MCYSKSEVTRMVNYQKLYDFLWTETTRALHHFERGEWGSGINILRDAQQKAEELHLEMSDEKSPGAH